jgi:hypothetical protein
MSPSRVETPLPDKPADGFPKELEEDSKAAKVDSFDSSSDHLRSRGLFDQKWWQYHTKRSQLNRLCSNRARCSTSHSKRPTLGRGILPTGNPSSDRPGREIQGIYGNRRGEPALTRSL